MTAADAPAIEASLPLREAVALCTAWMQHVAAERGIRLLVLKGESLQRQGLRRHHVSSDVDVLVEPSRFSEYVVLLVQAGWAEFTQTFASDQFVRHSVTFRRPGWPNAVDVHSFWPGFLEPADAVFDELWVRRQTLDFAHRECNVPDRAANILMLALHSLRGAASQGRHLRELDGLSQITLTDADRRELASLARSTGSEAPLREVLPRLGVPIEVPEASLRTPDYLEWRRKVAHAQGRTASWLIELRRAPWRRKVLVIRHGIWPTDHDLLAEHPTVPDRAVAKVWARILRLGRGLGQLPRVVPALRRR